MKLKNSQKKTRREKNSIKKKYLIMFIGGVLFLVGFLILMNQDFFRFQNVQIEGQKTLMEKEILSFVDEQLKGNYVWIIPRDNIIFFSKQRLRSHLESHFPRLQNIQIERRGQDLIITSGERLAHSLWCVNKKYEDIFDEECYYADVTGVLYSRSPYFSGNLYLKVYFDPSLISNEIIQGSSLYSEEDFLEIFRFVRNVEEQLDMSIHSLTIDALQDISVSLARIGNIRYDQHYPQILFQASDAYDIVFRNLKITLDTEVFKRDFEQQASLLKIIDIRFPGRTFYRFSDVIEHETLIKAEIE